MWHADWLVDIDRMPRSNVATYTGLFDHVRRRFADALEARSRGYKSGRFSFNITGGRCPTCEGEGSVMVELLFLPSVYPECPDCHGTRYKASTLEVTWRRRTSSSWAMRRSLGPRPLCQKLDSVTFGRVNWQLSSRGSGTVVAAGTPEHVADKGVGASAGYLAAAMHVATNVTSVSLCDVNITQRHTRRIRGLRRGV